MAKVSAQPRDAWEGGGALAGMACAERARCMCSHCTRASARLRLACLRHGQLIKSGRREKVMDGKGVHSCFVLCGSTPPPTLRPKLTPHPDQTEPRPRPHPDQTPNRRLGPYLVDSACSRRTIPVAQLAHFVENRTSRHSTSPGIRICPPRSGAVARASGMMGGWGGEASCRGRWGNGGREGEAGGWRWRSGEQGDKAGKWGNGEERNGQRGPAE